MARGVACEAVVLKGCAGVCNLVVGAGSWLERVDLSGEGQFQLSIFQPIPAEKAHSSYPC